MSRSSSPSAAPEARRPSIFSRLHSSIDSIHSTSSDASTSSALTRAHYAKDGRGHDFTSTYPYAADSTSSSSSASTSGTATPISKSFESISSIPIGNRSFYLARARYAKDGKGHDFNQSYMRKLSSSSTSSVEDSSLLLNKPSHVERSRYAKDGKGFNFSQSYKYHA